MNYSSTSGLSNFTLVQHWVCKLSSNFLPEVSGSPGKLNEKLPNKEAINY